MTTLARPRGGRRPPGAPGPAAALPEATAIATAAAVATPTQNALRRHPAHTVGIRAALAGADVAMFAAAVALTAAPTLKTLGLLLLTLGVFNAGGLYRPRLSFSVLDDAVPVLGRALAAGAAAMVIGGLEDGVAGLARLQTSATFALLALGCRGFVYSGIRNLRRRGWLQRRCLLLGAGAVAGQLAANMLAHPEYGMTPEGMLDDDPLQPADGRIVPVLGACADLNAVLVERDPDVVIVTFGSVREPSAVDMLRACDRFACEIYLVPRLYELHGVTGDTEVLWGIPLLRLRRAPFRTAAWVGKRMTDVVLSGLALAVMAPALLLCGLFAWAETGHVLYRQTRIGLDRRQFVLLKFCTMAPGPDGEDRTLWNIAQDDRVGPVGRLLRRTSLDELPQLWNVLRGEMSLVGPRPERPHFVEEFTRTVPWYTARHRVPAGLTGWAQIHGLRGDTSIADRARFDNFYIENWSLWGDVKILLRTVGQVAKAAGR